MAKADTDTDVVIVGAGAAGLAAAKELGRLGLDFRLVEASRRIGGRACTEQVGSGFPFDLGCHWLHSGSLNPFVKIADELGVAYTKDGFPGDFHLGGRWADKAEEADWEAFNARQEEALAEIARGGQDRSVWDVTARDESWTGVFDYIQSLYSSQDVDLISVIDLMAYRDTEENWPVKDGYGTLVAAYGGGIPVSLDSAVTGIDWSGPKVSVTTARGGLTARAVLLTVSTGILGAGDIQFRPTLPPWKQEAIAGLPLGNHNKIGLIFEKDVFGPEAPEGFLVDSGEGEPLYFRIRPFGFDYAVAVTGGRFADWLERAGTAASLDLAREKLAAVLGNDVTKHVSGGKVSAWRTDPWIRGAYSCALPGQAHQRAALREPLDEQIFFAGEATSAAFFSTAHGAYLSGLDAAREIAATLADRSLTKEYGEERNHA